MKKQSKQNILTAIIVILVLILAVLIFSIIYEQISTVNSEMLENNISSKDNEDDISDEQTEKTESNEEEIPGEEYVGEEEKEANEDNNNEETIINKEDKAIELAKKEWGEDDTVTFSIEEKKGSKYYVAVKSNAIVEMWYEIDTYTWEISEY